jgi:iron uptake system component EfeO
VPPSSRAVLMLAAAVVLGSSLAACSQESDSGVIAVAANETTCKPASTTLDAGVVTFEVKNTGSKVTEIYVLTPAGGTVAERENILPGTSVKLTTELAAGSYSVRCRPGDTGDGIATPITVTGSGGNTKVSAEVTEAVESYRDYVTDEAKDSLAKTKELKKAIEAGDVANAKLLYVTSRIGWERTEPVAEAFGDLDPKIDLREADLESGQTWTGWHVIEKGLWTKNSTAGLTGVATTLVADLEELLSRIPSAQITGTSMANGAKELLDEVATGKISGEEEVFSHTDLVDFQANVDGARKVYDLLKPRVKQSNPALVTQLDSAFANLQKQLNTFRTGELPQDFPTYDTVPEQARAKLSVGVDALSEPLSHLAAAVA